MSADLTTGHGNILLEPPECRQDTHHVLLRHVSQEFTFCNIFCDFFILINSFNVLNEATNFSVLKCTTLQKKSKATSLV
jgi:hypothetical protein